MNMKKSLAVITAILTAVAFAGCSSGSDSSETETEETTTSAVSSDAAESAYFDGGDGSESDPYWMASGILKDCDEDMIKNAIELFSTENLAG